MADITAVIASGGTESSAAVVGTGQFLPLGLYIPALTTSTAVTFKVAAETTDTFVPLYDTTNTLVSITASTSAARATALDPIIFGAWNCIKCVVADAQSGVKTFTFSTR
jgi:hypothetical protein